MSLQDPQSFAVQIGQNLFKKKLKGFGVVYSVILDETHPLIKKEDTIDASLVGAIEFRFTGRLVNDSESLPVAYPFDKNVKTLPIRNESVEIYEGPFGDFYYRRVGAETTSYTSVNPKYISTYFSSDNSSKRNKSRDYSRSSSTGIAKTTSKDNTKYDGYGDYFVYQKGIHKLKLYEGDSIWESRFGQSIRFSGYNNFSKTFSPTIIIRNSENEESKQLDRGLPTTEDVNKDGSVIVMGSNEYELPFLPGTVNESNTSDFETKPESFQKYPSLLNGDQILINSGRVIISAKNAEMIFYSKKNYGFISDGGLSIDNKLGIDINVGDNVNIVTNDRDIVMYTGNGSIFLGNKDLEPVVKGQQLVDILSDLIDAITNQQYLTPAGPTSIGPTNLISFGNIKAQLNNILSKLNQTS